jgi:autotransporter strand-loop-strand O-heptosyltransferase
MKTTYLVSYNDGAFVEILGNNNYNYEVTFTDKKTNNIIHSGFIKCNEWIKTNQKYYTEWYITIKKDGEVVYTDLFDCTNKKVKIYLPSVALGDNIAWIPYCDEFRKKHNCNLTIVTNLTFLFSDSYPEITFVKEDVDGFYSTYNVHVGIKKDVHLEGIDRLNKYYKKNNSVKFIPNLTFFNPEYHPEHPMFIPWQKIASNILGLEFKEIRPSFKGISDERPIKEKYICISEFASSDGMKEWNNQVGWKNLISSLKSLGYKIISISKEKTKLNDIIKRNGDYPLSDRMWYLKHCEFFIGLGSGLSWLSWACGKKTVMIGGFSKEWCEFQQDNIRVINHDVCTGCWNSPEHADKLCCYHATLCPENKNFECSRKISPKMVLDKIKENGLIK